MEDIKLADAVITPATAPVQDADTKVDDEVVVDYKSETVKLQEQLKKAEFTIVKLRQDREGKSTIDADAVREVATQVATQEMEKFKADATKDLFEVELENLSTNPDERELIRLNYEKKIVKSGFNKDAIRSDLMDAKILANRPKYEKNLNELRQTIMSKAGTVTGSTTGQAMGTDDSAKLSPVEEAFVKSTAKGRGVTEESVRAKLLANKRR